jgi:hypothetical protein
MLASVAKWNRMMAKFAAKPCGNEACVPRATL